MDQGLAAVLGATVGVAGTLGASVLAYIATRRQASDQGAIDRAHKVREERREAYLNVMDTLDLVKRELLKVFPYEELHYGGPLKVVDWEIVERLAKEIRRLDEVLDKQANRMKLAGPKAMDSRADAAVLRSTTLYTALDWICHTRDMSENSRAKITNAYEKLDTEIYEFTVAARDVLLSNK